MFWTISGIVQPASCTTEVCPVMTPPPERPGEVMLPTGREREDRRDATCSGDRDQFRVGVDGDSRAQVGLKLTDLTDVARLAHLTDLDETDRRPRVDQAGVDMQSGGSEDRKSLGDGERGGTNGRNLASIDQHDAVRNVSGIDRMNRRANDGVTMSGLSCSLAPRFGRERVRVRGAFGGGLKVEG